MKAYSHQYDPLVSHYQDQNLQVIIESGDLEALTTFLENNPEFELESSQPALKGKTVLYEAIKQDQVNLVQGLLSKFFVNPCQHVSKLGKNTLHLAATKANPGVVLISFI